MKWVTQHLPGRMDDFVKKNNMNDITPVEDGGEEGALLRVDVAPGVDVVGQPVQERVAHLILDLTF